MEVNMRFRYPSVIADFGYESEEAYEYLKRKGQIPYMKLQTYKNITSKKNEKTLLKYNKNPAICFETQKIIEFFAIKSKSATRSSSLMILRHC